MVHVSREQAAKLQRVLCRARFTSPSSYSCYSRWSESQGKCSLAHCCDLYPFSFLPSHLCPVAVLLSQISSQKWDQCAALALPCAGPWSCQHLHQGLLPSPGLGASAPAIPRAHLLTLLSPRAVPMDLVRRLGSNNKHSTKPDPVPAQLLSEDIADRVQCINSAQSGS